MLLHVFSYQPFVTVVEMPNLDDRKGYRLANGDYPNVSALPRNSVLLPSVAPISMYRSKCGILYMA